MLLGISCVACKFRMNIALFFLPQTIRFMNCTALEGDLILNGFYYVHLLFQWGLVQRHPL